VSDSSVVSFRSELEALRRRLREGHLNAVREVLKDSAILSACREVGHEFRARLLAPVVAVFHMIAAALWPDFSFQASWQVFGSEHVSSGSLAKARGRLPEALFENLSRFVAGAADRLSESLATWRGHRVVDLDGTCVSMEDNPTLKAEFGVPSTRHGPGRYPVARLVAGILWGTMAIVGYAVGAYTASEQALATRLLPFLRPGDLLVGDRHFAGANLYATYLSRGLEFLTRVHQRLKIGRLRRLVEHSAGDFVVEIRLGKKHRREDPGLPESVTVRLIRVEGRVRGKFEVVWLATSLRDAGGLRRERGGVCDPGDQGHPDRELRAARHGPGLGDYGRRGLAHVQPRARAARVRRERHRDAIGGLLGPDSERVRGHGPYHWCGPGSADAERGARQPADGGGDADGERAASDDLAEPDDTVAELHAGDERRVAELRGLELRRRDALVHDHGYRGVAVVRPGVGDFDG